MAGVVWAVIDGPRGTRAVELPDDKREARRLRGEYRNRFWCSTEVGGCGEALELNAGDVYRPYFHHRRGSVCAFIMDSDRAGRSYEHLQYQQALASWLVGQGYDPTLEKVLADDGRTDLHVVVNEVSHAIEVQLSPLSTAAWDMRNDRYARQVDHVTWLFGPGAKTIANTVTSLRGLSFALRPGVQVAVRDMDDEIQWSPLTECRLTESGFYAPGIKEAQRLRARREAEREEAARLAAEKHERLAEREERVRRVTEARRASALDMPLPAPHPTLDLHPGLHGVDRFEALHPEVHRWQPPRGSRWLDTVPPELHRHARAFAYATQELTGSSPTAQVVPQVTDARIRRLLFDALQDAGWIRLYQHEAGFQKWERCY
ncbi:MAG: hypothetical protein JWO67_6936 [Streptosporangiaceae bacterium]|nr:hypothetical protein [Streptosporangiaceae bacterium]